NAREDGAAGTAPGGAKGAPAVPASPTEGAPAAPPPAASPAPAPPAPVGGVTRGRVLTPGGSAFEVEVAQDIPSRERGLQQRARLPEGEGMLFIFPNVGRHRFWMYKCLIPLDLLWLDANGTVVHIEPRLPICPELPCRDYVPAHDALYVLEIGSGVAAKRGI